MRGRLRKIGAGTMVPRLSASSAEGGTLLKRAPGQVLPFAAGGAAPAPVSLVAPAPAEASAAAGGPYAPSYPSAVPSLNPVDAQPSDGGSGAGSGGVAPDGAPAQADACGAGAAQSWPWWVWLALGVAGGWGAAKWWEHRERKG